MKHLSSSLPNYFDQSLSSRPLDASEPEETSSKNVIPEAKQTDGTKRKLLTFDVAEAKKHGQRAAVILGNFRFWIGLNASAGRNFRDGHYWTYYSVPELALKLDAYTERQVRYELSKLIKKGVLKVGIYNKHRRDRTRWFRIEGENMTLSHQTKSANDEDSAIQNDAPPSDNFGNHHVTKLEPSCDKFVPPLPDINPNPNPNKNIKGGAVKNESAIEALNASGLQERKEEVSLASLLETCLEAPNLRPAFKKRKVMECSFSIRS